MKRQPTLKVRSARCARVVAVGLLSALMAPGCAGPRTDDAALPGRVEAVYDALDAAFDEAGAFSVVDFMDQFWRLAGNPGFDATVDHLRDGLVEAGFAASDGGGPVPNVRVEEYENSGHGWDYETGTLRLEGDDDPVLSREQDRVSLCINSFPTPPGGLTMRLVDVGTGTAGSDYDGRNVKGAVVLGDGQVGALWREAVRARGAAGVISTAVPSYVRPATPEEFIADDQWDVFQWGSIPYDDGVRGFGFKASYRAAQRLRDALAAGRDRVTVEIASTFHEGAARTLVAEIPGRSRPDERIVMVAHIQEPGANDDASGCASLYGLARALLAGIRSGAIPPPERTLTFIWGDEIRASRQWLADHEAEARNVQYMFSLDMTGEDVAKTGGSFLVEKQPDPSAVWERPSDPHTEWGAGRIEADSLEGSLLNDLHLFVCARRAKDTGWLVQTNPYEGGSDHTVFWRAGVPSLLDWHFTDRYYHTNLDRPDKVSAAEVANVGVAVATSAWWLASAGEAEALAAADVVERAALARLALERGQGRALVSAAEDRVAAEAIETEVFEAWKRWYGEALDSVLRLPAEGPPATLRDRVAAAKERVAAEVR